MIRQERRKRRRRRRILKIVLVLAVLAALGAAAVLYLFTVESVEVEGNEIYSDEAIESWVLEDEYSWSSLYLFVKYRFLETEDLPFVSEIEVSLRSPHDVTLTVTEKGILGYVYISSLDTYAYIDSDGLVVEFSDETLADATKIVGLSVESAELYEALPLEDSSIFKTLLNVSQLLEKYELTAVCICVTDDSEILLDYGEIQVNLGSGTNLNEKMIRLQKIMPQLEEMSGTLHLEDWSETNTDVYFSKDELAEIPER